MPISFGQLFGMWVRKTPLRPMLRAVRASEAAGVAIPLGELEAHTLAGGNPERVVAALIEAKRRGQATPWRLMAALDLGGRDPLEALNPSFQMPLHALPMDLLRERAQTEPPAAEALASKLVAQYTALGDTLGKMPSGGVSQLIRDQTRAIIQGQQLQIAEELATLVPRLTPEARQRLPALQSDA